MGRCFVLLLDGVYVCGEDGSGGISGANGNHGKRKREREREMEKVVR